MSPWGGKRGGEITVENLRQSSSCSRYAVWGWGTVSPFPWLGRIVLRIMNLPKFILYKLYIFGRRNYLYCLGIINVTVMDNVGSCWFARFGKAVVLLLGYWFGRAHDDRGITIIITDF